MNYDELLAMLRHASRHYDLHHAAALAEIRALTRVAMTDGMTDEEFRAKTTEILDAVQQVNDEIDEAIEAGAR